MSAVTGKFNIPGVRSMVPDATLFPFDKTYTVNKKVYYILINEILRNIDEIKCVFSFSVFSL
jgi:hypothetical protein